MNNIKSYQIFESESNALTPEQIRWLDLHTNGEWTLDPQTGQVDVNGDFNCHHDEISDFKGIKFGFVTGSFTCGHNRFTSLEGAPQRVGGNFFCSDNLLTSLEGAPQKVGGYFQCGYNRLTSLKGAPLKVGGDFGCSDNLLTSLEGAPQEVEWDFWCSNNSLTSLEGAPRKVGGDLDFDGNPVKEKDLERIYHLMRGRRSYQGAVRSLWEELEDETKVLIYRPSFDWLTPEEHKKWSVLQKYQKIKSII
jgi:hypothetical protein